jgi:hypothetical protein
MQSGQRGFEPGIELRVTIHEVYPLEKFRREERIASHIHVVPGPEDYVIHRMLGAIVPADAEFDSPH